MTVPPNVPEGVPQTVEMRMAAYYDLAAQDINLLWLRGVEDLLRDSNSRRGAFREQRAAQLAFAMQRRLAELGDEGRKILRGPTEASVLAAILRGEAEADEMGLGQIDLTRGVGLGVDADGRPLPATLAPTFVGVNADVVRTIAEDTAAREAAAVAAREAAAVAAREAAAVAARMGDTLALHAANARQVFRSVSASVITGPNGAGEAGINRAIVRGIISGDPIITDRAVRELFRDPSSPEAETVRKLGNKQVTVGKATMSVRQYAATLTRTRMREATVSARHDTLSRRGIRLVQITGRQSANFCTAFVGLVCSLDGSTEANGVPVVPISSLPSGGPPFHPNCSKGTAAFVVQAVNPGRVERAQTQYRVYQDRLARGILLDPVKS